MVEIKADLPVEKSLYDWDEELISLFFPWQNGVDAAKFALRYASASKDHYGECLRLKSQMYVEIGTGINLARVEFAIWNYAIEQAHQGNWCPLSLKFWTEGRRLLDSDEVDAVKLGMALKSLAASVENGSD